MTEPAKKSGCCLFTLLKIFLALVVIGVAIIAGVGFFVLDGKYDVAREVTIKAPPEAIHKQVGDLREWPNWLPFIKQDPSVKTTIVQPTGVGANQHWTSDHGNGKLDVTESDPQKGIAFTMLFDEKYASKASITYTPSGDATKVVWHMTGQNGDFLGRWMAWAMPYMVGPAFETGLGDLKEKVEQK